MIIIYIQMHAWIYGVMYGDGSMRISYPTHIAININKLVLLHQKPLIS